MRNILYCLFIFYLTSIQLLVFAQKDPEDYVSKEFPMLYNIYKDNLKKQKAHYIFAIDVSSSMGAYELTVKNCIRNFLQILPEGDEVTMVKELDTMAVKERATGYINYPNLRINSNSKKDLLNSLDNISFNQSGSDGYSMTDCIINAIKQTGSEKLVYVFIFTDFEYWNTPNQFNKKAVNWNNLVKKLDPFWNDRTIIAKGLRITISGSLNNSFEDELIKIFHGVEYIPVASPQSLEQWFANEQANMLANKLKYIIENDLKSLNLNANLQINQNEINGDIVFSNNGGQLFTNMTVDDVVINSNLSDWYVPINISNNELKNLTLCKRNQEKIAWFPRFITADGNVEFSAMPSFEYINELGKLGIKSDSFKVKENFPSTTIFIHILPWWVDVIILLLIIFWVVCFLYTKFKNLNRNWQISVTWKDKNGKNQNVSEIFKNKMQFTVGVGESSETHLSVSDAQWKIKIETRSNCPCMLWKKTGYYLIVEEGDLLELEYPYGFEPKILGNGNLHFLSAPKKFRGGSANINQNKIIFKIDIS